MELILLAGNSNHNKEWIEGVERSVGDLFEKTHIQYYKHWRTEGSINVNHESKELARYLKGKKDVVILAKSAGIALYLKCVHEGKSEKFPCLFLGLPFYWCLSEGLPIEHWLKGFDARAYFVQKELDPAMGGDELVRMLNSLKVSNHRIKVIKGNDHHYEDIDSIKESLIELINRNR